MQGCSHACIAAKNRLWQSQGIRETLKRIYMTHYFLIILGACIHSAVASSSRCPNALSISVVYNALIWPDQDWRLLITSQLEHLKSTGLAECSAIHVAMSVPAAHGNMTYGQLEDLLLQGKQLVHESLSIRHEGQPAGTIVSQVHENSFEYPALHLLWLLAQVETYTPSSSSSCWSIEVDVAISPHIVHALQSTERNIDISGDQSRRCSQDSFSIFSYQR